MLLWHVPTHLWDPTDFLDRLTQHIEKTWIDISKLFLDHICYRTSSHEEYEEKKSILERAWSLLVESEVAWRQIAVYKLSDPIKYKERLIDVLELPAPKENSPHESWREHVEFVLPESLESFYLKHYTKVDFITKWLQKKMNADVEIEFTPWLACKFHNQSLEKVIEWEKVSS